MKVQINGEWHDAEKIPMHLQLSASDKSNISNMLPEAMNYYVWPDNMKWEDAKKTIETPAEFVAHIPIMVMPNSGCLVRNYKRKHCQWETGEVVDISIEVNQNGVVAPTYRVRLDRTSKTKSRQYPNGGGPIFIQLKYPDVRPARKPFSKHPS